MAFQSQEQAPAEKEEIEAQDTEQETIGFTQDEVSKFYNIFITITENLDPNNSDLAAALVKASAESAELIKQKGSVSKNEEGAPPTKAEPPAQ